MKKIITAVLALSMILALGSAQAQSKTSHKKKAATEAIAAKKDHVKKDKKEAKKASASTAEKTKKHAEKTVSKSKKETSAEAKTAHSKTEKPAGKTKTTVASNGKTIQTGPRGGKYYINKNGHKTYLSSEKKSSGKKH